MHSCIYILYNAFNACTSLIAILTIKYKIVDFPAESEQFARSIIIASYMNRKIQTMLRIATSSYTSGSILTDQFL